MMIFKHVLSVALLFLLVSNAGAATVSTFSDGDTDLDLTGEFPYAFHAGPSGSHTVRDVTFIPGTSSGAVLGHNAQTAYGNPNFGASDNDIALAAITDYVIYDNGAPGTLTVDLPGLMIGKLYKLQMMFLEAGTDRGFNVFIEGNLEVANFWPGKEQGDTDPIGGPYNGTFDGSGNVGVLITHSFVANDDELNISLVGASGITDDNPLLDALTLELVPEPSSIALLAVGTLALLGFRRQTQKAK